MGSLSVQKIDMYERENAIAHHTSNFDFVRLDQLTVLRRGQSFKLKITCDREYVENRDKITLFFILFDEMSNSVLGTRGIATVRDTDDNLRNETWTMKIVGAKGLDVIVEVRSPSDIPVGIWNLHIQTTIFGDANKTTTFKYTKDIYFLFNPWAKKDMVYMENEKFLDEYILNDVGKIWLSKSKNAIPDDEKVEMSSFRTWPFGQFDATVLQVSMLLFKKSQMASIARADPIRVCRMISKMVNSNDDDGILEGKWVGKFPPGTNPVDWTGSLQILNIYLKKQVPVKYGQCWVFAGIVTTICRALGIPSRIVTNFNSAMDLNVTLSVDKFYDWKGDELNDNPLYTNPTNYSPMSTTNTTNEGTWNFHVWNEVWMARPDLPKGYGGWQAIDATPQVLSGGLNQCGPASVEAIRQGAVGYNYDVDFMVASVNADCMYWTRNPNTSFGWTKFQTNRHMVGRKIVTKAPGITNSNYNRDYEDITAMYKETEGTDAEWLNLLRAVRGTPNSWKYYAVASPSAEDVEFNLTKLNNVKFGESFTIVLNVTNKSNIIRHIQTNISVHSVFYHGVKGNPVKKELRSFIVGPNNKEQVQLTVTVDDYFDKLVDMDFIKFHAFARVKETHQVWADESAIQVIKPIIKIETIGQIVIGKPLKIILSFQNPLKKALTKCVFTYVGPDLSNCKTILHRDIASEEAVTIENEVVPEKAGRLDIIATFTSNELTGVKGYTIADLHNG